MKIVALYATHKRKTSTTYQLAQTAIAELAQGDEVMTFDLLNHVHHFCNGCFSCFNGRPERCPAFSDLKPLKDAIKAADLIIFAVPVYVYHVPGQVKTFLDHFAYEWMMHRPDPAMFNKQALIISTAAGGGTKSTVKDIKDSLEYLGISSIYDYQKSVYAARFTEVDVTKQQMCQDDIRRICHKIKKDYPVTKPGFKVKQYFHLFRKLHQQSKFSEADHRYWEENGWLGKKRPWDQL